MPGSVAAGADGPDPAPSSAGDAVDRVEGALGDVLDRAGGVDRGEEARGGVVADDRGRLLGVALQAVADDVLLVVRALDQFRAALVAGVARGGGAVVDVEDVDHLSGALAAAGDALDPLGVVHLQVQDDVRARAAAVGGHHAGFGQDLVQDLRLGDVAREAVEEEAVRGVGLGQPVADDVYRELVRDQLPGVGVLLRLHAQGGAAADVRAEDVAGGDLRHAQVVGDELGLRALARTRRAYENDAHYRRSPSASWRRPTESRLLGAGRVDAVVTAVTSGSLRSCAAGAATRSASQSPGRHPP